MHLFLDHTSYTSQLELCRTLVLRATSLQREKEWEANPTSPLTVQKEGEWSSSTEDCDTRAETLTRGSGVGGKGWLREGRSLQRRGMSRDEHWLNCKGEREGTRRFPGDRLWVPVCGGCGSAWIWGCRILSEVPQYWSLSFQHWLWTGNTEALNDTNGPPHCQLSPTNFHCNLASWIFATCYNSALLFTCQSWAEIQE